MIGEPGVGKSRLCYEFTRAHVPHGWRYLETSAASYGQTTPYLPVIDLLKAYFQLDAGDDLQAIRAKVTDKLLALDATLQPTLPALLVLLEVANEDPQWQALDPPQRRRHIMDAVKQLLLRESQVQPLLLIVENLHWIDGETQGFLDSFVESLPAARVLLLVSYRPDYQHGWGSKTYYTQLRLDPLSPASAQALANSILGHDASVMPLTRRLIELTEGNPLFLEESIQTLVETQALTGERGAYRLVKALQHLQVPATVHMVLAARLDRLSVEGKRLLQIAAVIGRDVPFSLLQAIAERPAEALRQDLAQLQRSEFLYERGLFPELAYTFKHALTHEVAYGSLQPEQRRALHAPIVGALEAISAERLAEQVERLAHHALRGEVWDKAVAYCRQSGAKARAREANREMVTYLEQALIAMEHLPESRETREQTIDVHLTLQNRLWQVGELPRMLDHLQQAERLATALGDQKRLGAVFFRMSFYFFLIGHHDRAVEAGERALAIAKALADIGLEVDTNLNLGRIYLSLGDYRRAMDCLRWNVDAFDGDQLRERFGERYSAAGGISLLSRSWLGRCLAEQGAFADGIALVEGVVRVTGGSDAPATLSTSGNFVAAYRDLGHVYLYKGALHKAIPALERGLTVCREASTAGYFPIMASLLGAAYALVGRVAEALPLLEQAVEEATSSRLMYGQSLWVSLLGEGYLLAGRLEDANTRALQAVEFAVAIRNEDTRRLRSDSLGISMRIVILRRSSRPRSTTASPSALPTTSACARFRATATSASAPCMPRWAGGSRRARNCPLPSSCTAPWT
jgi:tetratricopeptide (TPR) repeat protein